MGFGILLRIGLWNGRAEATADPSSCQGHASHIDRGNVRHARGTDTSMLHQCCTIITSPCRSMFLECDDRSRVCVLLPGSV